MKTRVSLKYFVNDCSLIAEKTKEKITVESFTVNENNFNTDTLRSA